MHLFSLSCFPTVVSAWSKADQSLRRNNMKIWDGSMGTTKRQQRFHRKCLRDNVWRASCSECFGAGTECEE